MVLGKNTKQLLEAIINTVSPVVVSLSHGENKDKVGTSIMQSLNGNTPDIPAPPKVTGNQRLSIDIFRHFTEIHTCLERLKDFETYISKFPFQKTRVSRHAYLQFIVEAQLSEIYILRERLVSFSKKVSRAYRKDVEAKKYADYTALMENFVMESFDGFTRVRGAHTHTYRYSHNDIDRLSLIALLEKSPDKSFSAAIKALKRMAVVESHQRLSKQTRTWNKTVSKVVDEFCRVALILLFDKSKKNFRYPKYLK